jgi:hypothetical protein
MEVHHHPHLHHQPKPWKEYLLEGLMIFIAVTMGFFAESLREHIVDNKKEHEYIISLKEDLLIDTASLNNVIPQNQIQFEKLDSLYTLLDLAAEGKPVSLNRLYYLNFRYGDGLVYFSPDKRTMTQIKSTGSFALIKNKVCRDSITDYDNYNEDFISLNVLGLRERTNELTHLAEKIFNFKEAKTFWFSGGADVFLNDSLKLQLSTTDKQLLQEYENKVRSLMMMVSVLGGTEQRQLTKCKNIIALLNKEYHLETE